MSESSNIAIQIETVGRVNLKCEPGEEENFIRKLLDKGVPKEVSYNTCRVYPPHRIEYIEFGIPSDEEPMTGKVPTE